MRLIARKYGSAAHAQPPKPAKRKKALNLKKRGKNDPMNESIR